MILDGTNVTGAERSGLFKIYDKAHIIISNLHLIKSTYAGFFIEKSQHITIRNCTTYDTFSSGIGVWESEYITIDGNEIELACNDGEQECITIAMSSNCEIRNNHVHHNGPGTNGGEGIDIKHGSHDIQVYKNLVHNLNKRIGIYADAWDTHTYNIDIFQNEVHHCGNSGFTIQTERGGLLENINIFNNISYYNKWDGISVGSVTEGDDINETPVRNVTIINNSCYKNGAIDGGWGVGILIDNPDAENIVIRNNICSENSAQIAIQKIRSGESVDHNLIYGNNSVPGAINGSDAIIANPLFEDPEKNAFHLKNNSPAIDTGINTNAPLFDFRGIARPVNSLWDIGAYEKKDEIPYSPSSILLLLSGIASTQTNPEPHLLFSSGFEGGIYIESTPIEDYEDYRFILGSDIETGFSWPIQILGAIKGGLHYIEDDGFQAVSSEIQTVTGHDGTLTKALYNHENYTTGATQCPYEILDITEGKKDLYIRYWIKMDTTSLTQPNKWRTFFEWKTIDYADGSGFRLIAFIYTDENGIPYWHWQGDANPETPIWEIDKQNHSCSTGWLVFN